MLRTYKLYDFPYTLDGTSNERVPAVRSSFSSQAGWIYSGDDFYVLSSGLVVQETTIGLNIAAFYLRSIHFRQAMTTQNCTNTSFRPVSLSGFAMFSPIALPTMAPSGLRFTRNKTAAHTTTRVWEFLFYAIVFYRFADMILDYNLFKPGQPLVNGTFWLCEQVPGYIVSNDLSQLLQENGHFGSCSYLSLWFTSICHFV